jgi:hypothetical protein
MNNEYLNYAATERQKECVEAVIEHDTYAQAANALGINVRTLERTVQRVKQQAARKGYSPEHDMTRPAPDGFTVKGTSTLYDAEGNVSNQWVKTQQSHDRQKQLMEEAVRAMAEEIPREAPVSYIPQAPNNDLLNLYTISDYHFGMLAWHEETGADWDTRIAEDMLVNWFAASMDSAPQADVAVLAELGDGCHYDSFDSITPTNRHLLDSDTRFPHMVRVMIRAFRRVVQMLLQKYPRVHIIMAEGNHDPASSVWMREWFAALYENEPRVTVDTSPDPFYAYEWGDTSLFWHHGHLVKQQGLDQVFASKFRELFGCTKYSYGHSGHLHHKHIRESRLMTLIQHPTLAAKDSHASRHGYESERGAAVDTYHKKHGKIGEVTLKPEMVL